MSFRGKFHLKCKAQFQALVEFFVSSRLNCAIKLGEVWKLQRPASQTTPGTGFFVPRQLQQISFFFYFTFLHRIHPGEQSAAKIGKWFCINRPIRMASSRGISAKNSQKDFFPISTPHKKKHFSDGKHTWNSSERKTKSYKLFPTAGCRANTWRQRQQKKRCKATWILIWWPVPGDSSGGSSRARSGRSSFFCHFSKPAQRV